MEANSKDNKTMVTVYVSNEIIELVEDTIFFLKKQMPLRKRTKVSKSMFFEAALKLALADYSEKKSNSQMFVMIQNHNK